MSDKNGSLNNFDLRELLTSDTVLARVSAKSWQEAANQAGQLLIDAGKVESRYVEKMKQSLEEIGPYVVVAPGIALLHARPDDGVIEPCVSLVTLKDPVEFGHSENDPVDVVFAFGAKDKQSHIPALRQLAGLLENLDVINNIRNAETNEALLEAFHFPEQKGKLSV